MAVRLLTLTEMVATVPTPTTLEASTETIATVFALALASGHARGHREHENARGVSVSSGRLLEPAEATRKGEMASRTPREDLWD